MLILKPNTYVIIYHIGGCTYPYYSKHQDHQSNKPLQGRNYIYCSKNTRFCYPVTLDVFAPAARDGGRDLGVCCGDRVYSLILPAGGH